MGEAQYADRAEDAIAIGETAEIHFYTEDDDPFAGADAASGRLQVTVIRFELGPPPGCTDDYLSVCSGELSAVAWVEYRVDNPTDFTASFPDAGVVSPQGKELQLYVCPTDDDRPTEMLPLTTATVVSCFGSDSAIPSLSGWLARVSAIGISPEETRDAYFVHD